MAKLKVARIEGVIIRFFEKLAKTDLLILDDFGIGSMEHNQQLDFMEIIEDRHARKSTIISSQLPPANWFELFTDETVADAFLDRVIHTSHRIGLKGVMYPVCHGRIVKAVVESRLNKLFSIFTYHLPYDFQIIPQITGLVLVDQVYEQTQRVTAFPERQYFPFEDLEPGIAVTPICCAADYLAFFQADRMLGQQPSLLAVKGNNALAALSDTSEPFPLYVPYGTL